jgi:hypothetical protein
MRQIAGRAKLSDQAGGRERPHLNPLQLRCETLCGELRLRCIIRFRCRSATLAQRRLGAGQPPTQRLCALNCRRLSLLGAGGGGSGGGSGGT